MTRSAIRCTPAFALAATLAAGVGPALRATAQAPPAGQAPAQPDSGTQEPGTENADNGGRGEVGERYISPSRTWSMEFPDGWRQLTPRETHALRKELPEDMLDSQPMRNYALGFVDQWMASGFDGVSLLVVEQSKEWVHDETLPTRVTEHWHDQNSDQLEHQVRDAAEIAVGKDQHMALRALRTTTYKGQTWRSLDLYVPTGSKELILSFRSRRDDFATWEPRFRAWIDTASFARPPRGQPTLTQRLWPWAIGGIIAVGLLFGYRSSRRTPDGPKDGPIRGPGAPPLTLDPRPPAADSK